MKDQIHYSLANYSANVFELVPYFFGIFKVYNIKGDLIIDAFSNDLLDYIYYHMVSFNFFDSKARVFVLGPWFC